MNRRQFLKGGTLALGAMGLPRAAKANAAHKRLLIFYTQHGTWYDAWKMRAGTSNTETAWDFQLTDLNGQYSPILQPLARYAERTVIIDGLSLASAELDNSGLRHELGGIHSLTGGNMTMVGSVPLPSSASIDQIIAATISSNDQFTSLELGVGENPRSVIARGPIDVLPICNQPSRLARRLIGGNSNGSLLSQQQRVIAATQQTYQSLSNQLSGENKQKIEQHADMLFDLGTRIEGLNSRRNQCEIDLPLLETSGYHEDFTHFNALINIAFCCDMTRVISLQMGQMQSDLLFPGETFDIHSDVAHKVWVDPGAAQMMTHYGKTHAQQLAELLDGLDSTIDPLGDGNQSLLDNTMVLWVGEMGDGAHGFDRWPAVIIGGNGFSNFRYNRYLYQPSETPIEAWSYNGLLNTMAQPHQQLLVSIAQQFGLDITSVGEQSLRNGRIDCSGPLSGLS